MSKEVIRIENKGWNLVAVVRKVAGGYSVVAEAIHPYPEFIVREPAIQATLRGALMRACDIAGQD